MKAVKALFASAVMLAPMAQAAVESTESPLLEEILVHGKRASLAEMRNEMIRIEDRFYARYNELNANDPFDIHCSFSAPIGTRLKRRYCRAVFQARALEEEGRAHLRALLHQSQGLPASGAGGQYMEWIAPVPASVAIARQQQDLRRTMLEVTGSNPELVELLRHRKLLAEKYEERRREYFGLTSPQKE